jgi:hypothetical protein
MCREDLVADGFMSADEMKAAVDDAAEAACQADPRKGVVRIGKSRAVKEAPSS